MTPAPSVSKRYPAPKERLLKVYAFDPSRGRRLENFLSIRVPYETGLQPGPVGHKIAVIDYDATNRRYYDAVDLNHQDILAQNGLDPSESNPQFHQQMVYAIVMETIRRFEFSLGREIKWAPDNSPRDTPYHGKLRVLPHAMQAANAFYDPRQRALLFGYFSASAEDPGTNLPGQPVFTCLSHDIIVHETTHAIIDGVRRRFKEHTSIDTPAFHEGFADVVALLQHFSFKETLLDTIQRTGGLIHRSQLAPDAGPPRSGAAVMAEISESNPIIELARQFGEAMGNRRALRSALGTPPASKDIETVTEPHARGAIFVAAVFDAFFSVYLHRTRDLFRIAYPDGRAIVPNYLHPDLASRLAEEAARTAARFQNICIRALDYCPPVDIQFGDFLRAVVTADSEVAPSDDVGYRAALIDAFRARGIHPEGVISYSEEALKWPKFAVAGPETDDPDFRRIWDDYHACESDPTRRKEQEIYRRLWGKTDTWRLELGLSPSSDHALSTQSLNIIHRVRPDGRLQREIVAEVVQTQENVEIFPGEPQLGHFDFRGGATLLISREGVVLYSIAKPIHGSKGRERLDRQREYFQTMASGFALAPYVTFSPREHLSQCAIHRGY